MPKITAEELKKWISYDPNTGYFTRACDMPKYKKGDPAGYINFQGYRAIKINGVSYISHRLAFIFMGHPVPEFVDHINGVRDDNRWCNLRAATRGQNNHNAKIRKDNTSGVKGVSWLGRLNKWQVSIMSGGVSKYIGIYSNLEDAKEAAKAHRELAHGDFHNHG